MDDSASASAYPQTRGASLFDIGFSRVWPRHAFAGLVIVCLAIGASAAWSDQARAAGKAESVVSTAVIGSWPVDLHPLQGDEFGHVMAKRFVNRPLLEAGPGGLTCVYCVSVPSVADGSLRTVRDSNGTWITIARYIMRPDVRWADGVAMTTADVAFTWDVLTSTGRGLADSDQRIINVKSIQVIDERRFDVVYTGSACSDQLSVPPLLPAHLEKPIWQSNPAEYFSNSLYRTKPGTPGLYSGPYRVVAADGTTLHLEENIYWPGQKPAYGKVDLLVPANQAALETAVRAGKVDVFTTLTFDVGSRLARDLANAYNAFYAPSDFLVHLKVNFTNPILSDLRVRKALLFSLNRDALVSSVLEGKGTVAQSLLSPFMPGYAPVSRYPFNLTKANQLLDVAGWVRGRDGMRHNISGVPLRFELRYRGNHPWPQLAPRLAEAWQAVGAQVDLVEDAALSGDAVDTTQRYSGLVGFSQSLEGGLEAARFWFHSTMIPNAANGKRGNNYFAVRIKTLDDALDHLTQAGCAVDPRRDALTEVQKAYADDLPALPLWFGTVITLANKRIDGAVDARTFASAPVEYWHPRL
ncbi:ABC transporter substrate-binding protein [Nitrospirillum amazonense]|uniref:ABC transporter substrate-binding protein n=1 Tax=Nitrospirillum amazonense TaxID=28077 RepID=UPI00119FB07F|nr:ABC transporter substrate-binding protein [Nitrospirillum amazonense]